MKLSIPNLEKAISLCTGKEISLLIHLTPLQGDGVLNAQTTLTNFSLDIYHKLL